MALMIGGPLDGQRVEVNLSAAKYYSHSQTYTRLVLALNTNDAVTVYVHSEEALPLNKLIDGYRAATALPKQATRL